MHTYRNGQKTHTHTQKQEYTYLQACTHTHTYSDELIHEHILRTLANSPISMLTLRYELIKAGTLKTQTWFTLHKHTHIRLCPHMLIPPFLNDGHKRVGNVNY